MQDKIFIQSILQKGNDAGEKVKQNFSSISEIQLNWKPSPDDWSIGQCLQHLIRTHIAYFPVLKEIADGTFKMDFWQRRSPLTKFWGRTMKNELQEQVTRKVKAPRMIQPTKSEFHIVLLDRYHENLEEFLELISRCNEVDLDKTIMSSPLMMIVTYSLRDAFQFLLQHEHRHLNQAMRVKQHQDFPL